MEETRIAGGADIPEGEVRAFEVGDAEIAVANVGSELLAFSNVCTHQQCSLDDGDLEDASIICACHGSQFDLRTGEVISPPATEPIEVYGVAVEGDDLVISGS
ncbi:MAG TPA: non-heme iron oxygenase ferredoxin subunit [Actinomycetota bacterium]